MRGRTGACLVLLAACSASCGIRVGTVAPGPPAAVTSGVPAVTTWALTATHATTVYSAKDWERRTWPANTPLRTGRDTGGAAWVTWLAFDLGDVRRTRRIGRAWLELVASESDPAAPPTAATVAVHVSDRAWTPQTLSWRSAPAVMPRPVARQTTETVVASFLPASASGPARVRFDVSRAVDAALEHGLDTITFVLVPTEGDVPGFRDWITPAVEGPSTASTPPPGPVLRIHLTDAPG